MTRQTVLFSGPDLDACRAELAVIADHRAGVDDLLRRQRRNRLPRLRRRAG